MSTPTNITTFIIHLSVTFQTPHAHTHTKTKHDVVSLLSNDLQDPPMMAITEENPPSNGKVWGLFKLPFRNSVKSNPATSSSSPYGHQNQQLRSRVVDGQSSSSISSVSSVARSFIPTRRRLRLDPANKLYFPCKFFL